MTTENDQSFGTEPNPGNVTAEFRRHQRMQDTIDRIVSDDSAVSHIVSHFTRDLVPYLNLTHLVTPETVKTAKDYSAQESDEDYVSQHSGQASDDALAYQVLHALMRFIKDTGDENGPTPRVSNAFLAEAKKGVATAKKNLVGVAKAMGYKVDEAGASHLLDVFLNELESRAKNYLTEYRRSGNVRGILEDEPAKTRGRTKEQAYVKINTRSLASTPEGKVNLVNLKHYVDNGLEAVRDGRRPQGTVRVLVTDASDIYNVRPLGRDSKVGIIKSIAGQQAAGGLGVRCAADLDQVTTRVLGSALKDYLRSEVTKLYDKYHGGLRVSVPKQEWSLWLQRVVATAAELPKAAEAGLSASESGSVEARMEKGIEGMLRGPEAPKATIDAMLRDKHREFVDVLTKLQEKLFSPTWVSQGRSDIDTLTNLLYSLLTSKGLVDFLEVSKRDASVSEESGKLSAAAFKAAKLALVGDDAAEAEKIFKKFIEAGKERGFALADPASMQQQVPGIVAKYFGDQAYWGEGDASEKLSEDLMALLSGQLVLADADKTLAGTLAAALEEGKDLMTQSRAVARELEKAREEAPGGSRLADLDEDGVIEAASDIAHEAQKAASPEEKAAVVEKVLRHLHSSGGYDAGKHAVRVKETRVTELFAKAVEEKLGDKTDADSIARAIGAALATPAGRQLEEHRTAENSLEAHLSEVAADVAEQVKKYQGQGITTPVGRATALGRVINKWTFGSSERKTENVSPIHVYLSGDPVHSGDKVSTDINLVPGKTYELEVGPFTKPLKGDGPRGIVALRVVGGTYAPDQREMPLGATVKEGGAVTSELPKFLDFASRSLANNRTRYKAVLEEVLRGVDATAHNEAGENEDATGELSSDDMLDAQEMRQTEDIEGTILGYAKGKSTQQILKLFNTLEGEAQRALAKVYLQETGHLPKEVREKLKGHAENIKEFMADARTDADDLERKSIEKLESVRGEITEALPSYKVLLSSFPGMKPNSIIETLTGTSEFAELLLNRVLPRTGVSMVMSPQTRDAAVKASLVQMFEENQDLRTAYLDAAKTRDSMKTDMPDDFPLYKHGFGGIVKDYTTAFNGVWRQLFEKGSGKQGITAQRRSLFLDELNEFREADKERFDRMFHMAEGTDADSEVTENSSIRAFMPTSGSVHANSPSQVLAAGRSLAQAKKAVNQFRKLSESLSEGKHAYDRKAAEYLQNLSDKNPDLFGKLFASADEDGEAPGKLLDLRREGKDRLLLEMSPEGVKLPSVPAGYPSVLDYNKLTKYPTVRALLLGFKAEGKDTDLATTLSNTMEELGPETIVNDVKARLRYSKETDDSGSELGETITHAMSKNIEEALHDAMKGNPGFEATGKVLKKVDFSRTRAIAKASTLADLFDAAKASYEAAVVKKELLARYKGKDAKPSDPEVQKATLLQHFRKLLYKEPEQFVRAILDFAKDKEAVASIPDAGEREILESLVAAKAQPKVRGKKKKNEEDSGEPAEAPEALSKKASDDLLMLTVISNTYSNIFHA